MASCIIMCRHIHVISSHHLILSSGRAARNSGIFTSSRHAKYKNVSPTASDEVVVPKLLIRNLGEFFVLFFFFFVFRMLWSYRKISYPCSVQFLSLNGCCCSTSSSFYAFHYFTQTPNGDGWRWCCWWTITCLNLHTAKKRFNLHSNKTNPFCWKQVCPYFCSILLVYFNLETNSLRLLVGGCVLFAFRCGVISIRVLVWIRGGRIDKSGSHKKSRHESQNSLLTYLPTYLRPFP